MCTGSVITRLFAAAAIGFGIYMVDIDMTKEAALPEVDIAVEGGQCGRIQCEGTEDVTMDVPTIGIDTSLVYNRVADNQ